MAKQFLSAISCYPGAVGSPGLYLGSDTSTGFYRIGANNIGLAISGTKLLDISSGSFNISGTLSATGIVTIGNSGTGAFIKEAKYNELLAGSDAGGFYFAIGYGVNPAVPIFLGNTGSTYNRYQTGGYHTFGVSGVEKFRVHSTGASITGSTTSTGGFNTTNYTGALKDSSFGYSSSYKVLQLGFLDGTHALSFGVDVSGNPNGSFTGHEIIFPHTKNFIAPNTANTGFHHVMSIDGTSGVLNLKTGFYATTASKIYNSAGYGTLNLDGTSGGYSSYQVLGVEKGNIYGNAAGLTLTASTGLYISQWIGSTEYSRLTTTELTVPALAISGGSLLLPGTGSVTNNLRVKGTAAGATGISGFDSADAWKWQLYGDGTYYGFLNSNWGGWDLTKAINGQLSIVVSSVSQTVLHTGNYNSYTPTLTGTGASGTWGISISGNAATATTLQTARSINGTSFNGSANIKTTEWYHSGRDFPLGTLITTDIDYSVTNGDPWILEIKGNSYGQGIPFDIQVQGYIYSGTIINYGGYSNGSGLVSFSVFNNGGYLCFWFNNAVYWQGFNVRVYSAYATYALNRVTNIQNVAKPGGITKEVSISLVQSLHSSNYTTYAATAGHNHSGVYEPANANIQSHISSTSNPHSVTKSQVGLSAVENTALSTWAGSANITTVGTVTTGTWSGLFGSVSGANLTSLTAGNLSGTIPSAVLGNSTHYIGTTAIVLNRSSAAQSLTGITSIDGSSIRIISADTRAVADTPQSFSNGLEVDFKQNTTDGLADGGTYHGVVTVRQYGSGSDWSGGGVRQLGFTDNHQVWIRGANADTTWSTWYKILHTGNFIAGTNYLAPAGNGSALTGLTASQVGLGNVTNESKATMFTSPTFTNNVTLSTAGALLSIGTAGESAAIRQAATILNNGWAAPSNVNTVSNGDKLVTYNAASLKIAVGQETGNLWFQSTGGGIKFYTGASTSPVLAMTIASDQSISTTGPVSITNTLLPITVDAVDNTESCFRGRGGTTEFSVAAYDGQVLYGAGTTYTGGAWTFNRQAGGASVIAQTETGGVSWYSGTGASITNVANNVFLWNASGNWVSNVFSTGTISVAGTTKAAGKLYAGTSAPTNVDRLNYDGYFYATRFYGDGSQLSGVTSSPSPDIFAFAAAYG